MDEDKNDIDKLAEHLIRMEYKAVEYKMQQNEIQKDDGLKKDKSCCEEKSSK
jgi:hypothetical protein